MNINVGYSILKFMGDNKMNKNTKFILLVISALVLIVIFREEIKLVLTIIGIFVVAGLIFQWLDKNKH